MKVKALSLAMAMVFSQTQAYEVENYYINGIRTTDTEAERSARELREKSYLNQVGVLYNHTNGTLYDLMEAALLSQDLLEFYNHLRTASLEIGATFQDFIDILNEHQDNLERGILLKASRIYAMLADSGQKSNFLTAILSPGNYITELSDIGFTTAEISAMAGINNLNTKVIEIATSFRGVFNSLPNFGNGVDTDLNTMYQIIHPNGNNSPKRINLLAHSEGNSFSLLLADRLDVNGDAVKVVHVATPEGEVFQNSPYITLEEDVAHWFFLGSLPANESNYTQNDWDIGSIYGQFIGSPIVRVLAITSGLNYIKYADPLGHNFVNSYLHREQGTSDTGAMIPLLFRSHYLQLSEIRFPGEPWEYNPNLNLGDGVDGLYDSDEMSYYRSGRYARHYNLNVPSCRRVQIDLVAERSTDAYLYLHANGVLVGRDDDSYGNRSSRLIMDLVGGNYQIEATTYSSGKTGIFSLNTYDLGPGNCQSNQSDIYVTDTSLSVSEVNPGQEIRAYSQQCYDGNVTVSNLGAYPRIGYYLSSNSTWGSSDIYLDYDSSSIGSDDLCDGESEYLTIPSNTSSGYYYILFVADYTNQVSESDENNNVSAESIYINSSGNTGNDDIYLSSSSVSDDTPARGQEIRIRTTVRYDGSRTVSQVGTVYTSYYLISSAGTTYFSRDTSSIGTDDPYDGESQYVTIPSSAPLGLAYIEIKTDDKNGVSYLNETNEDNNVVLIPITIHWFSSFLAMRICPTAKLRDFF